MARFSLPASATSSAVAHRQVVEIWYFISGSGELWCELEGGSEIVGVSEGVSLTIPAGCGFQLRADPDEPLVAVAVTTPPWPGDAEAVPAEGPWVATVGEAAQTGE